MKPKLRIRKALVEHLPAVICLEEELFSNPWTSNILADELTNPTAHFYVAEDLAAKTIVGYMIYWLAGSELELQKIAVATQFQRQGIAACLLEHLLAETARAGVGKIFLEVRVSNLPAIRFYEKHGFRLLGRRKEYYSKPSEDALVYSRLTTES